MSIKSVLFDLDGTFADTAPDLNYALNLMRTTRHLPTVAEEKTRPVTSSGARGLLGVGFEIKPDDKNYAELCKEFLENYENNLCRETRLFAGMPELIEALESNSVRWGIVTNKAERFAIPLINLLGYGKRAACVIGGDSTPQRKPHPEPLFAAARRIGIEASQCIYVGDDERDIQAGRSAGMKTIAVRYGYLNGSSPDDWGADAVIDTPMEIIPLLTKAPV